VSAARVTLFALLAAGAGSVLIGAPAGVVMAIAVGAPVGYRGRGAAGIGLGAFCGLIAAGVVYVLEGNELLLVLYAIAVGVSLVGFAECAHTIWREGHEKARAAYEQLVWNARPPGGWTTSGVEASGVPSRGPGAADTIHEPDESWQYN
jgi:hypothetical protein